MILTEKLRKYEKPSFGKINKYEYFTGEEIVPSDQSRIIGRAKLTYSPLGKF